MESLSLVLDVIIETAPHVTMNQLAVLSGPSFAKEVALGLPADLSLASQNTSLLDRLQSLIHSPTFRVYTTPDTIGVQIGGAVKNVMAIGCGACHALEFGQNALAALITRGLAEITRLGVAMGANPLTFLGLSGLGDLILTCTSPMSRNWQLGYQLGKGESLDAILKKSIYVIEGMTTVKAVMALAKKYAIDMPISQEVHAVLYDGKPLRSAAQDLMEREKKQEGL